MNIVHFSYSDTTGALGAAYELHRELIAMGHNSIMIVREKTRKDNSVIECGYIDSKEERMLRLIERLYFDKNRKPGTSPHTIDYLGLNWTSEFEHFLAKIDIVHLHWCMGLLSLNDIQKLIQMGKKIVWTMHDFHPMTGLCHCPENCTKYEEDCSHCPQVINELDNITQEFLLDKQNAYGKSGIRITAASNWLKEKIHKSAVFRDNEVFVIPIGIHTDIFYIDAQSDIKNSLGLTKDCKVILMGAQALGDNVKGYYLIEQMIYSLCNYSDVKKMCKEKKLCIVTFGDCKDWNIRSDIPIQHMGFISDRNRLRDVYNMADVFLFPSTQETFGMTAVEAMACGVPVVAFDISAMSDVIIDGVNGYKVEVGNYKEMAKKVNHILKNNPIDAEKCRRRICENYSIRQEAEQMLSLYQSMGNSESKNCKRPACRNEKVEAFFNKCVKEIAFDEAINQGSSDTIEKVFWKYNNRFMNPSRKIRELLKAGILKEQYHIYIYGAGKNGIQLEKEMREQQIIATSFWDMDEAKWGQHVNGIIVEPPREHRFVENAIVLISIAAYDEAVDFLTKKGFTLYFNLF